MAKIGVKYLTVAPVTSYADGALPVYGEKAQLQYAVEVNTNYEYSDAEMFGDNLLRESDNGMTGYSVTANLTDLSPEVGTKFLAWKRVGESYRMTGDMSPKVGFGYVGCGMVNGVKYFEGYWHYMAQFSKASNNFRTKERQTSFNPDEITGKGMAIYPDATGEEHFVDFKRFETEAEAKTFVDSHVS